jgi:uncharacterized protein
VNAGCLRETREGTFLEIKVQPRASRNEISGILGDEMKICVTAPPVDSAANKAVIELIAEKLGCSRSAIKLVKGETSRHKTLLIQGFKGEQVSHMLGIAKR